MRACIGCAHPPILIPLSPHLNTMQVCLFSYGQTGSGKTFTMQGSGFGPMKGIIPRAMEQVRPPNTNIHIM